jgi:uncharacterized surface protein with fasciclin (FAS1) repeats
MPHRGRPSSNGVLQRQGEKGAYMSEKLSLIEKIANQDKFSTFSRYLKSSGADEVFSGEGEFTVFAPTNDAFAKIPDKLMNELLQEPGQDRLKAILKYHVLRGRVTSAQLVGRNSIETMAGKPVVISEKNGIRVNTSTLQSRDIVAGDGLIHQIDTVLAPPAAAAARSNSVL